MLTKFGILARICCRLCIVLFADLCVRHAAISACSKKPVIQIDTDHSTSLHPDKHIADMINNKHVSIAFPTHLSATHTSSNINNYCVVIVSSHCNHEISDSHTAGNLYTNCETACYNRFWDNTSQQKHVPCSRMQLWWNCMLSKAYNDYYYCRLGTSFKSSTVI